MTLSMNLLHRKFAKNTNHNNAIYISWNIFFSRLQSQGNFTPELQTAVLLFVTVVWFNVLKTSQVSISYVSMFIWDSSPYHLQQEKEALSEDIRIELDYDEMWILSEKFHPFGFSREFFVGASSYIHWTSI